MTPIQSFLFIVTGHWLSLLGTGLVTTSVICWVLALPAHLRGHVTNPYIGILLFIFLPAFFILGLCLIPLGVSRSRQKIRAGLATVPDRPTAFRRLAVLLAVCTVFNVLIGSQLTYKAIEHMETTQFCGQTCHVMKPEFTAYQNAVHSRVLCVECHVAPGASGWVASKVAGTRQLVAVALNNYPRPIASAIESNRLVPASQTCEQCHWPQLTEAPRVRVIPNYQEDENNTPSKTVLMMYVRGPNGPGIHGSHFGPGITIRYAAADAKREIIPWVEYRNDGTGTKRRYLAEGTKQEAVASMPVHEMQCMDCHNRAAHSFELPERAVNRSMAAGEIPPNLPFIKKKSLELLKADYPDANVAQEKIASGLREFYRGSWPAVFAQRPKDIDRAGQILSSIYTRNVFPDLKVTWGTYQNNLGHTDSPGCFRCHDGSHSTSDQKSITQDCSVCHNLISVDEEAPEILKTLSITRLEQ